MEKIPINGLVGLIILVLFVTLGDSRIAAASNVVDKVATCTHHNKKRIVTLDYRYEGRKVPCQVVYEKPTEKPGYRRVLWRAKNSVGYCERRMKGFIRKLGRYGWKCSSKPVKSKTKSEKPSKKKTPSIKRPPKKPPPLVTTVASTESSYKASCRGQQHNLANSITKIAKDLSGLKFSSRKLQDCSGIFHKFVRKFKTEYCPNDDYPKVRNARTTRGIAKWYHQRGELILVHNVLKQSHLIKPGAVMFYGRPNRKYKNFKANDLFIRGRGINHLGVVVSVDRDAKGRVVSYKLFHGRRPGKPSGITNFHKRKPTRSSYPPLGNGTEQWVAIAPLVKQSKYKVVKVLYGEASYYANSLHGNLTANGERYDKNKLTAAHKKLPFGTRARVTYLKTGKSVELVINDRGPFYRNRIIDLSRRAAKLIGLIRDGHGRVKVEILK
jgi:rare lipoprotein A